MSMTATLPKSTRVLIRMGAFEFKPGRYRMANGREITVHLDNEGDLHDGNVWWWNKRTGESHFEIDRVYDIALVEYLGPK